ncbi:hypothetical protein [Desulfosporosinus youngiae]|uniref:Uncharacterized protein n=1 Tax=Desulfosporosinus youngiae DSM 17734 TaxID=768710 RepID=H5XXK3_9FIRM|nr:hypothetical protein [Desulfosporosinus youngiae]EHQ91209.1 hypothetical protein DesyoDRAFT_4252 [Desulfosporosinus youngiae DSM 17734]
MPKVTAVSYSFSLLFYGLGSWKTSVINSAMTGPMNTYNFTINASLAIGYFVLAIFFALTGSLLYYVKYRDQKNIKMKNFELQVFSGRGLDDRRRASIPELNAKLRRRPKYGLDLYRRMSS